MFGKYNKNEKSFNMLFSYLTFGLIAILLITSLYILVTTMLFKNNYGVAKNGLAVVFYSNYNDQLNKFLGVSITGIVLFILVAISFIYLVVYCVLVYLFRPICLKKAPIIWTIVLLSFSVFVMFILTMLGNSWSKNGISAIIYSFVIPSTKTGTSNVQYGGASITVLLFDIVIYCCSIVSITRLSLDFKKLLKNDFIVNQEENN